MTYQSDVISNLVRQQMACCDDDNITSSRNSHVNLGMDYNEIEQEPRRNDSQAHFVQKLWSLRSVRLNSAWKWEMDFNAVNVLLVLPKIKVPTF